MKGMEAGPAALSPPGSPQRVCVCACVRACMCVRERDWLCSHSCLRMSRKDPLRRSV